MNISLKSRKGNLIVEAAIIFPIFILAILMLISMIPVIRTSENVLFASADELRLEQGKCAFRKQKAALPAAVSLRILRENRKPGLNFAITSYRYFYEEEGIQDLISLTSRSEFREGGLFGLAGRATFQARITARAFTGADTVKTGGDGPGDDGTDETVCVFPERGTKYHDPGCTYVKARCELVTLSQSIKKKYHPCPECGAKEAGTGTPVFLFRSYGEAYHLQGCRSVDRYYVTMGRREAEDKGYHACLKCGG